MSRTYKHEGHIVDYSPAAAVAVDAVVCLPNLLGVSLGAIAASGVGSLSLRGIHDLLALNTDIWKQGDPLWWDPTNVRLTRLGLPTLRFAGLAAADKATGIYRGLVHLNEKGDLPECFLGRTFFDTAADLTMVAATHSGGVIRVTADAGLDTTITLPVGVVGMEHIIVNDEADGGNLLQVDLNGNEIIAGANLTIAATKLACNTLATAKRGDYLHLVCQVAATSWRCVSRRGIWVTSA